jgi:hypothetical protein
MKLQCAAIIVVHLRCLTSLSLLKLVLFRIVVNHTRITRTATVTAMIGNLWENLSLQSNKRYNLAIDF